MHKKSGFGIVLAALSNNMLMDKRDGQSSAAATSATVLFGLGCSWSHYRRDRHSSAEKISGSVAGKHTVFWDKISSGWQNAA